MNKQRYGNIGASIIIADIRNFTPNLRDSERSSQAHLHFCRFLAEFYRTCVDACTLACTPGDRSLYINSTGDGILGVFLSKKRHFVDAYLAGILLFNKLPKLFDDYNRKKHKNVAEVSFGLGIDSGSVWRVTSADQLAEDKPVIQTYIGDCINIAARVEAVTKEHDRTNLIVSENTYQLLCHELFDIDYGGLMSQATDRSLTGRKKKRIWDKMNKLDEELLLRFISAYNLRGVSRAIRLYRLSPTLASPKRIECRKMVRRLTVDEKHYKSVCAYIE